MHAAGGGTGLMLVVEVVRTEMGACTSCNVDGWSGYMCVQKCMQGADGGSMWQNNYFRII